jgi:RNA polymerase sigma-70 factor (ECF subfamily)
MTRTDEQPPGEARRRFESLWDAHYAAVLAYAMRRTGPEDARDVVAEAFTAAWRTLGDAPRGDPRLWLLGLARGALANSRRAGRRREALLRRIAADGVPAAAAASDPGLLHALARLPERDVEALLLVAWEGLTHAEAARVVGCATAAFTVRVHRARRRLAREMAAEAAGPAATIEGGMA